MKRPVAWTLLALCAAGCLQPPRPVMTPVRTIAVFPPKNRTGDPLLIAGASFLEKYILATEPYTVADALRAEAQAHLAQTGFDMVTPQVVDGATKGHSSSSPEEAAKLAARQHLEGAVLYIEIRRWEPNGGSEPTFVIAWVVATLVDASTGRVLWTADHAPRPVQTAGVISLGDAYRVAAHTLMTQMLAPLTPQVRAD
jgi:hypothetical protein